MSGCKNNGGKRTGAGRRIILPLLGSPSYEKTWQFIDNILIKGANGVVVAARLGVSPKTLYRYGELCGKWGKNSSFELLDFSSYKRQKKAIGDQYLIERQYDMAMGIYDEANNRFTVKPNAKMMIWVAKNRLGQSDKVSNMNVNTSRQQKPVLEIRIVSKSDNL